MDHNNLNSEEIPSVELPINCTDPYEIEYSISNFAEWVFINKFEKGDYAGALEDYKEALGYLEVEVKEFLPQNAYERIYNMLYVRIEDTKEHLKLVTEPFEKFMSVPIFRLFLKPIKAIGFDKYLKFANNIQQGVLGRICIILLSIIFCSLFSSLTFHIAQKFYKISNSFLMTRITDLISLLGHIMFIGIFIALASNLKSLLKQKSEYVTFLISTSISFICFASIFLLFKTNNFLIPSTVSNLCLYMVSIVLIISYIARTISALTTKST